MLFIFFLLWPGIYSFDPFSLSLKNIQVSAGKFKPICNFEISYNDERISTAGVTCSIIKRTYRGIEFEYLTKTRHKVALTFTILKRKKSAVVTNKNVETSRIRMLLFFQFEYLKCLVPCQLGYAPICNFSKSVGEKTAICPAVNSVKS